MRTPRRYLPGCWALLAIVASLALGADQSNRRESYADRYGPLTDHNIFTKDRTIRPNRQQPTRATQPARAPEESLVLRGVAMEDDGAVRAYVEDLDRNTVLKLGLGDAVGRGKIVEIGFAAIAYERNGDEIWIDAGADFTGKQVFAITSDTTSSATTGPAETINPNDPNLTLEQKLKLRRIQQLSK